MLQIYLSQIAYWIIISGPCYLLKSTWKVYGKEVTRTGQIHAIWKYTMAENPPGVKQHGDFPLWDFQETVEELTFKLAKTRLHT